MYLRRVAAVGFLMILPFTASAQSLMGAWNLEQVEIEGEGVPARMGGESGTFTNRPGLMILTDDHYTRLVVGDDRARVRDNPGDAELSAAWGPFMANGGTYALRGSTLTLNRTIAKHPNAMPGSYTMEAKFEGNDTLWLESRLPDSAISVTEKWVRME